MKRIPSINQTLESRITISKSKNVRNIAGVHELIRTTIKSYYSAGYSLCAWSVVCVQPPLAAGQKIFDIFWQQLVLHITS